MSKGLVVAFQATAVTVGDFANSMNKIFDCTFQKVDDEVINLTVGDNNCVTYQPGTNWPDGIAPEGVSVTPAVKIRFEGQFFWIQIKDYQQLLNACNGCCID